MINIILGGGSCMPEEHVNQNWRQADFDDVKQTFGGVIHISNKENEWFF